MPAGLTFCARCGVITPYKGSGIIRLGKFYKRVCPQCRDLAATARQLLQEAQYVAKTRGRKP